MLVKLNVPICTKTTETLFILLWGMAFVNVTLLSALGLIGHFQLFHPDAIRCLASPGRDR